MIEFAFIVSFSTFCGIAFLVILRTLYVVLFGVNDVDPHADEPPAQETIEQRARKQI